MSLLWSLSVPLSRGIVHPLVGLPSLAPAVFDFVLLIHFVGRAYVENKSFAKNVAKDFMPLPNVVWPERHTVFVLFVRACVLPSVRVRVLKHLTRYLAEYLTHFHGTYTSDVLWDRDECAKLWSLRTKVQGHGGVTYAGSCRHRTGGGIQYLTSRVELDFLVANVLF